MISRTPEDIILRSYQQFGGKSPEELLSTSEAALGFSLLNESIASYNSNDCYIPFLTTFDFSMPVGVDEYIFSETAPISLLPNQKWIESKPLIDIYFVNFVYTNLLYPLKPVGKAQFFRQFKITNLQGFPTIYFLERHRDFSVIHIYPKPSSEFQGNVRVKTFLSPFKKYDDIIQVPENYFKFLRYELGKELVDFLRLSESFWTQKHESTLLSLRAQVISASDWTSSIVTDGVLNTSVSGWQRAVNGSVILA